MIGGARDRSGIFGDKLKLALQPPYNLDPSESTQFSGLLDADICVPLPENLAYKASGRGKFRFGSDLLPNSKPPQDRVEMYSARPP
jgi:hypothetical protein